MWWEWNEIVRVWGFVVNVNFWINEYERWDWVYVGKVVIVGMREGGRYKGIFDVLKRFC